MTVRRIKADSATEDGDYIRIERRSRRGITMIVGVGLGIIICILYKGIGVMYPGQELVLVLLVSASALIGFFCDEGQVVRRVPKIDLVEIKRYTWPDRVTVIFDDERSMRRVGDRKGDKD